MTLNPSYFSTMGKLTCLFPENHSVLIFSTYLRKIDIISQTRPKSIRPDTMIQTKMKKLN